MGDTFEAQFNSGCDTWQYLTDKVIAPDSYTKIEFSFVYNYNTGTASVSVPFLYKENYGQSYTYDSEGNVVSSTDLAETEAAFAYQDNELTSSLSPTGTRYMYANDDTTQNTKYAVSNSGQKISFGYNKSGDATSMEIKDIDFISELEYTSGETVTCYIMNAKNGRVLEPYAVENDRYVYASLFEYTAKEKWQLRYLSGSSYSIRCNDTTSIGLYVNDNGGTQVKSLTFNSSGVPEVPFKFAIEPNDDGTFKISTAKSNHTKYLYQTDNLHYDGSNSYSLRVAEYNENDPAFKWYLVAVTESTLKMKTEATYTPDGLYVKTSTDAVGNTVEYTYGSNGLVEEVIGPPEPDSNIKTVTKCTYDNMGNPTKVESVERETDSETEDSTDTVVAEVSYTYDKDLLKKILVDEGLVQYSFDYDSYGRKVAAYVGNGTTQRTLASYVYEGRDLVRQNYGSSGTNYISLEYDSLDRPVKKTYNGDDNKYVEYLYDPNGNQYGVLDNIWGKGTYLEFDLAGRVNGVSTVDLSTKITRAYESVRYNDGKGTVESKSHTMFNALGAKLRTTSYTFTYGDPAAGQMPDVLYSFFAGGRTFSFTYDKLGRLTTRKLALSGTEKTEGYTYKASERYNGYTTTLVESFTDFTGTLHSYTYDANGNILTETIGNQTIRYEYDSQNRLTHYFDPIANITRIYVYDDRGNILEKKYADYMTEEEYNAFVNEYGVDMLSETEYTYGDSTWADLLTSYDGVSITYDELGNPLNWPGGRGITLTWQNGRQLAQYKQGSVRQYDYEYNADGLRTHKTITKSGTVTQSTEYYIVNGQYIGEVTNIGGTEYVIAYVYDENGAPAGINVNGSAYYFAKNLQGDVTALINFQGNIVAKYIYDAWGNIVSITDANGNNITSATHIANLNPFRYRGYMYDSETGFYYLRSRYYDPSVGRFINADLLIQSDIKECNLFIYGKDNTKKGKKLRIMPVILGPGLH